MIRWTKFIFCGLFVEGFIFQEPQPPPIRNSLEDFNRNKEQLISHEFSMALGSNITLNPMEEIANKIISKLKLNEIFDGFFDPGQFGPSFHFFESLRKIESSKLFKILRTMPKGGILHAHDTALGSSNILIDFTYKRFCWICFRKDQSVEFLFSRIPPKYTPECPFWELMEDFRRNGRISDQELARKLSMYPKSNFSNINEAWVAFEPLFGVVGGLIGFKDNFAEYIHRTLQEVLEDGVQYVEFRTSLRGLYDLDGRILPRSETAQITKQVIEDFSRNNPSFIGAKVIFSRSRLTDPTTVEEYLKDAMTLKSQFPNLICGFDMVGQEDLGKPLQYFLPELLKVANSMDFFFHAGETNWYGTTTDENLFDAVLLRTKRIGHGFALNKHPTLANLVKERDICIEVNPLSNQVLHLVKDLRNHPAAYFIANNFPMVISSDDPGFWGAAPLSHDFYVTFLGIASAHADLRFLKQLAMNSIKYSCMDPNMKNMAFEKWRQNWNKWIENIVSVGYV